MVFFLLGPHIRLSPDPATLTSETFLSLLLPATVIAYDHATSRLSATIATAPPSIHSPLSCSTSRWPAWSCHAPIPEDSCLLPLTERTAHKELNTNVLLLPTFDCWCAEKWEFTALGQHNKSTVRRLKPEVAENLPSPSSSPSSDTPHTAQLPGDSSSH